MESFLITPKDDQEHQFLLALFARLGIKSTSVSEEELEDLGLALLLKEVNRNEKVSRNEIFAELNGDE